MPRPVYNLGMMKRGLILFAVVSVLASWILGAAAWALKDTLGQFSGLVMLPLIAIPFLMAYVAHRVTGATGNPFRGLVWGNTSWYFAAWLLGLLAGLLVIVVTFGLKLATFDLAMTDYIAMVISAAEKRGQPMPSAATGALSIGGWVTLAIAPTLGPWFGAAMGSLSTLPWFGWFGRRLLVWGRSSTTLWLMLLFMLSSVAGGFVENPAMGEMPLWLRLVLMAVQGFALVPAMLWVFLRTRSAVITALAQASYQAAFAAVMPIMSDANVLFAPSAGLLVALGALLAGIALWVWKDPGGKDLAVAGVAFDGTPLTPEQLAEVNGDSPQPAPA